MYFFSVIWDTMPRKHIHKLGTPYRRNYQLQNLENALEAIVDGGLSFRQAEEQFGVPRATLYRRYRGQNGDRLGKPPVLNTNEENSIVEAITVASKFGYPFTIRLLKEFVQQYLNRKGVNIPCFANNLPGDNWTTFFLQRHQELSNRMSQNIKRARAEVNEAVITDYFQELAISIAEVPDENIINYDETNLTDDPGNEKVLVQRGCKHASRIMDTSKSSTSIMFAATGNGTLLPPYVVFAGKHLYPEWVENAPSGTRFNRSDSGWFDADTFEDWFNTIALPYFRRKEGRRVLIGDNLRSHMSYDIARQCEENDISFIFFPANATHVCQPLDVAVFRPMKEAWRKILRDWKMKYRGPIPKGKFASKLKELLTVLEPNMSTYIKSGFRATGIIPLDPAHVLKKLLPKKTATVDDAALSQSFSNIMANVTAKEVVQRKRRKKINVPPGRSVCLDDFENDENAVQTEPGPTPGPSNINQREETETNEETEDNEETENNAEDSDEDELPRRNCKTALTNFSLLKANMFVVVSFVFDEGTKKEKSKEYVAKILEIKENETCNISCMRNFNRKTDSFVFPNVTDLWTINKQQIKFVLSEPVICRGIHVFESNVI